MFPIMRLATVHPLLAHFTLGGLPLIVVAYAMAAWRRSPSWTLIGDAALGLTAALTLATGIFGLVSNAVVPWPGGIERWRWLHLGGGVATTLLLLLFALVRLVRGQRERATGAATLAVALAVCGVAGATGWIGGEVLVFHAGMAVRAAGDGALAPSLSAATPHPRDFLDAMRGARAAWGGVQTRLAFMLVQRPSDDDFARVGIEAQRLQLFAQAMADFARPASTFARRAGRDGADAGGRRAGDRGRRAQEEPAGHRARGRRSERPLRRLPRRDALEGASAAVARGPANNL